MVSDTYSVDIVIETAGDAEVAGLPCTEPSEHKAPSPCFVGDLHLVQRDESVLKALLKSQRTLIQNYLTLGVRGVFHMSTGKEPVLMDAGAHLHPIQDPCAPQTTLKRDQYVQYVLGLFLLPHELPKWLHDWQREYPVFDQLELTVVSSEPLLSILTCNPLSEAEYELGNLVDAGEISNYQACVLRGGCFFLLGSCIMSPDEDVLEQLAARMSTATIGRGVVSLLLTLYHLANSEPAKLILYRAPYGDAEDQAAQVLLYNAMSGHANQLRVGPYRAEMHASEPPHIVQRMLSSGMLARAKQALAESSEPPERGGE